MPVRTVDLKSTSANWALPDWGAAELAARTPPDWTLRFVDSFTVSDGDGGAVASPALLAAIADAEVYFGFGMPEPLFRAAPALRWVQSAAAGVASLLHPPMLASNVLLTNAAGLMAEPIADHVVGGVLHFLRGFDVAMSRYRAGVWDKTPFIVGELLREASECHAVIVGAGGIGSAVARRLSAHGMRVTGVRRRLDAPTPPGFDAIVALDALDGLLPDADVVVLAAAATASTRGVLTAERLAQLPVRAIVANVGRGALVDESALAAALRAGRLRGAVVDVFTQEPVPADHPYWGISNLLFTPHISAISPRRFWRRQLDLFFDNWTRYRDGAPLRNLVDKHAGY
ncbi:MAG: D-2-hydroxyacid dehydrogenase [Rhodospirillaceae bacterium]|nr:D-2-hydroxyacid dehydrogenase [Rhodospirillaceae bacterium]